MKEACRPCFDGLMEQNNTAKTDHHIILSDFTPLTFQESRDIIRMDTLVWKLKLLKSGAAYANSRLHAVQAEVLLLARYFYITISHIL